MAIWHPCKRSEFIRKLRALGFEPPEPGTRHFVMRLGSHKQVIPRNQEFSIPQLRKLIGQIEAKLERRISAEEWDRL
jgi:hypothetical protein